jgi:predicted MFS family arabinose efflux permease
MEIARVVAAFGAGLFTPSTSAVAVSLVEPERRGWALSRVFIGFTAAQGIGNPIGAWLGYTFSWQVAFLVVGIMALLMTIALWRLIPGTIPFRPTSLSELIRILLTPHMLVPLLFTFFYVAASYTTLTYLTLILETRLHLSGNGISLSLAIYGGMAFVAAVISGWLTDTFSPSRILYTLCVLMAIFLPLITQGPAEVIPSIAILAAWSLSSWSHFTAQQSRLVSINPAFAQLLLALNSSMLYVGIAGGSIIAAHVLPVPEFRGLAVSSVTLVAIAVVVLWIGDRMIARARAIAA